MVLTDQAIIVFDKDKIERMVILFSESKIVASGDPSTFAYQEAEAITRVCESSTPEQCSLQFEDLVKSYKTPWVYGGGARMVNYSGKDKKYIDTLVKNFSKSAKRTASKKESQ